MKVTVEELAPCKKKVHVEVDPEEMDKKFQEAYRELQQKTQIPGFRPGKAPLSLLKVRFGDYVRDKVLEKTFPETYEKAIEEAGIKVATEPNVPVLELEEGRPFKIVIEVEEEPDFELKEYEGLEIEEVKYQVTPEEVERFIGRMRDQKATLSDREDKTARDGDLVVVDYDIEVNGEVLDSKKGEGMSLVLGSGETVSGFEDGVVGHKVDDTFPIGVEIPQNHYDEALAGKSAKFIITLKEVKEREIPELNDDFAKEMGYESLEEMKEKVMETLREEHEQRAEAEMMAQIRDKLVTQYDFSVPSSLVEKEVEKRLEDEKFHLRLRGADPENADVDWEDRRKGLEEEAIADTRFSYLLSRIAEAENIEVDEGEMRGKIDEMAQRFQRPVDEVMELMYKTGRLQSLSLDMLHKRVLDFLLEHVKIVTSQEESVEEAHRKEEGE
jgi:trigger factor